MSYEFPHEELDGHPETFDTMFGRSITDFLASVKGQLEPDLSTLQSEEVQRIKDEFSHMFISTIVDTQSLNQMDVVEQTAVITKTFERFVNSVRWFQSRPDINQPNDMVAISTLTLENVAAFAKRRVIAARHNSVRPADIDNYRIEHSRYHYWIQVDKMMKAVIEEEKRQNP